MKPTESAAQPAPAPAHDHDEPVEQATSLGQQVTSRAGERAPQRFVSLDAYRGATMLLMASSGFGIPQIAKNFPDSAVCKCLGHEFDHAAWTGCTLCSPMVERVGTLLVFWLILFWMYGRKIFLRI